MTPQRTRLSGDEGFTLIELMVVIVILGILMVFAVNSFQRARLTSNEAAAIAGMRAINSAQFAYASGCGGGNYAASLSVLGTRPPGNQQGYISADLGTEDMPTRNGYTFYLELSEEGVENVEDCNGVPTLSSYYATAWPYSQGQSG